MLNIMRKSEERNCEFYSPFSSRADILGLKLLDPCKSQDWCFAVFLDCPAAVETEGLLSGPWWVVLFCELSCDF